VSLSSREGHGFFKMIFSISIASQSVIFPEFIVKQARDKFVPVG